MKPRDWPGRWFLSRTKLAEVPRERRALHSDAVLIKPRRRVSHASAEHPIRLACGGAGQPAELSRDSAGVAPVDLWWRSGAARPSRETTS